MHASSLLSRQNKTCLTYLISLAKTLCKSRHENCYMYSLKNRNTNILIHQYKSITYMHASTKDMNKWMCKHWITYSTADQRIKAISGRHTGITPFPSHAWRAHAFPCSGVTHSIRTITGWNQQDTHELQWLAENFNGVNCNWWAILQSSSLKSKQYVRLQRGNP